MILVDQITKSKSQTTVTMTCRATGPWAHSICWHTYQQQVILIHRLPSAEQQPITPSFLLPLHHTLHRSQLTQQWSWYRYELLWIATRNCQEEIGSGCRTGGSKQTFFSFGKEQQADTRRWSSRQSSCSPGDFFFFFLICLVLLSPFNWIETDEMLLCLSRVASGFRETRAQTGCFISCVLRKKPILSCGIDLCVPPFQTLMMSAKTEEHFSFEIPMKSLHSKHGLSFCYFC